MEFTSRAVRSRPDESEEAHMLAGSDSGGAPARSLGHAVRFKGRGMFGSDVFRVLFRLPRENVAVYQHNKPRTPARLLDDVFNSDRVQKTIAEVALARSTLPESVAQEARTVLLGMGHTMSLSNLRFMAYLMQKILVQVYDDVLVDAAELNQIHEAAQQMPVLLLPTHRSYMDFLIISLLFFFEGLPVPAIAAGEDFTKMGFVSGLLRKSGAFFMRRTFGSDALYWSLFSEYVQSMVRNGDAPVEFFPEGTRSRTGKALHPRLGLLSAAIRPFFDREVSDMMIFPIGITYQERMEAHLYVDEMLGTPKPKESLASLLKARSVLQHNHGRMHVRVAKGISLREFCAAHNVTRPLGVHHPGSPTADERRLVQTLGYEVIKAHQDVLVLTPSALLAATLLHQHYTTARHLTADHDAPPSSVTARAADILDDVSWLMSVLSKRGLLVDIAETPALRHLPMWMAPLNPAAEYDERHQEIHVHLASPVLREAAFNTILLAHLRNELIFAFDIDALFFLALSACPAYPVSVEAAFAQFALLHSALYFELLLPTKGEQDVRNLFARALQRLVETGAVQPDSLDVTPSGERLGSFAMSLLRPFVQCVVVLVTVLRRTLQAGTAATPRTISAFVDLARELFEGGREPALGAFSGECLSANSLGNAVAALKRMGVLEMPTDAAARKMLVLTEEYSQSPAALSALLEQLMAAEQGAGRTAFGAHARRHAGASAAAAAKL